MADIILAFDESDSIMGSFNQGCLEFYIEFFEQKGIGVTIMNSSKMNDLAVQLYTTNKSPFVFVAYSHGSEIGEMNTSTGGVYLSPSINHSNFKNSFVYTVSCHAGKELGNSLIFNGCLSFLGYKALFHFWEGYRCFSECANYGLFLFIESNSSQAAYRQMIQKYNDAIDNVYQEDALVASMLLDNRNALVHLGEDILFGDLK